MNSYELSRKLGCTHSSLIPKIMNTAREFHGEVMSFERKSDTFIEMSDVAAAFMLLLLENKNG